MKLKDYAKSWLAYAATWRAASTIARYRTALNALAATLGERELAGITPTKLRAWHAERAKATANVTRAVETVVVCRFFRDAAREGLAESNPAEALERPPVNRQAKNLEAIWSSAREAIAEHAEEPHRAALLLLLQSGLRISELLQLRWEDVAEAVLWVRPHDDWKPKSKSSCRRIPQTAEAVECLQILKGCARNGYVCDMGSDAKTHLREVLTEACEAAGMTRLKPHDLRHLFLTHHAEIGTHIEIMRKLAGHASLRTTQQYCHLQERSLVDAMEKFR